MFPDSSYCDFLILAPLKLEVDALRLAFRDAGWAEENVESGDFADVVELSIFDKFAAHSKRNVVFIRLRSQGVLNACADTARALQLYEPGYVASFGIAGSLNATDAPIGSVIFGTGIIYYEPSKDHEDGTDSRLSSMTVGDELLSYFESISMPGVKKLSGIVASGEKLFASEDSPDRNRILTMNAKTLVVEMEAAGVAKAAERLVYKPEVLLIKGVSDLADSNKNSIPQGTQRKNREKAARSAARALRRLVETSPLRRNHRGQRRPSESRHPQVAEQEARSIATSLKPHGLTSSANELFQCLLGRRAPIPTYYHWRQFGPNIHWVDLKILYGLASLPKSIATPVPLVTLREGADINDPWHQTVMNVVGATPITDAQIRAQQDELSLYSQNQGLTVSAQEEIAQDLRDVEPGGPGFLLNALRYMSGQTCHRRLFVFSWVQNRQRWLHLSRVAGTVFATLEWDTLLLDGQPAKSNAPGKNLYIEPTSFTTLRDWLASDPDLDIVGDFVDHFSFLLSDMETTHPKERLEALIDIWKKTL